MNKKETLEKALNSIEHHWRKYQEYQYQSNFGTKKERIYASERMRMHANSLFNDLNSYPEVYEVINNGNPYQMEDFTRYVDSDMPSYLKQIRNAIDESI